MRYIGGVMFVTSGLIKGYPINFKELILDTKGKIVIPHYQRAYAWEKESMLDFVNDIEKVYITVYRNKDTNYQHFFGSIFLKEIQSVTCWI